MSNIEQLMAYHFPKDGYDNMEQAEIKQETRDIGTDDPECTLSRQKLNRCSDLRIEVKLQDGMGYR